MSIQSQMNTTVAIESETASKSATGVTTRQWKITAAIAFSFSIGGSPVTLSGDSIGGWSFQNSPNISWALSNNGTIWTLALTVPGDSATWTAPFAGGAPPTDPSAWSHPKATASGDPGTITAISCAAVFPARVRGMSAQLAVQYGKLDVEINSLIYFATDPDLRGNEATSRIVYAGDAYYPKFVNNAGGGINRLWQVACVKKALQYATAGQ